MPYHHAIGHGLTIVTNGLTSLTPDDLGKMQPFLDINAAKELGWLGPEPITVWGDTEWGRLIDALCAGLGFAKDTWDQIEYCGITWSDATMTRSKAPPMHRGNLKILRGKAENPDMYNKLMREPPGFEACDVLSETSTASPADADADDGEEIN